MGGRIRGNEKFRNVIRTDRRTEPADAAGHDGLMVPGDGYLIANLTNLERGSKESPRAAGDAAH
jgi:hypothetical protein